MKRCPYCGEEIQDAAIKCRYCREMLGSEPTVIETGAATSSEHLVEQWMKDLDAAYVLDRRAMIDLSVLGAQTTVLMNELKLTATPNNSSALQNPSDMEEVKFQAAFVVLCGQRYNEPQLFRALQYLNNARYGTVVSEDTLKFSPSHILEKVTASSGLSSVIERLRSQLREPPVLPSLQETEEVCESDSSDIAVLPPVSKKVLAPLVAGPNAPGFVYALINPSLPGLVKVGKTTRDTAERAAELSSTTGVPTPFVVAYEQYFADCHSAESFVHAFLEKDGYRKSSNREFFTASLSDVVKAINLALGKTARTLVDDDDLRTRGGDDWLDALSISTVTGNPWDQLVSDAKAYYYGHGDTLQDYNEALRLFKQAARLGSAQAYHHIGNMYRSGEGVRTDPVAALDHYKEATRRGHVVSRLSMALLFMQADKHENTRKCLGKFFENCHSQNLDRIDTQTVEHCFSEYIIRCLDTNQVPEFWSEMRPFKEGVVEFLDSMIELGQKKANQGPAVEAVLARYRRCREWVVANL